jgi:hypothetical protein
MLTAVPEAKLPEYVIVTGCPATGGSGLVTTGLPAPPPVLAAPTQT